MINNKTNIYDKDVSKQDIIEYCENIEYRLEQSKDKKPMYYLLYVVFIFSFLIGGTLVRVGTELLSKTAFDWYLFIIVVISLSPIVFQFLKTIYKER